MHTPFSRQIFTTVLLILLLILMLLQAPCVIQGAHAGLELWYEAVLPSILPFMIITTLLLQQSRGRFICFLGLLCGLPIGANLVNVQYAQQAWTKRQANILLCICNITSPMFIMGYVLHHTFRNRIATLPFLLSVYLPVLLYFLVFLLISASEARKPFSSKNWSASHLTSDQIFHQSLQVILTIGIIIMLFCIGMQFLLKIVPPSNILLRTMISGLEITNGIHLIAVLPVSLKQKTALIAGLTSFGGVCSILQTKHVITSHELSVSHYSLIKLCMGLSSYLLVHLFYITQLFTE